MNRRDRLHVEFVEDLRAAQACSERAINTLSSEFGPKRGWWYTWRLKRAQRALKSLSKQENKNQET